MLTRQVRKISDAILPNPTINPGVILARSHCRKSSVAPLLVVGPATPAAGRRTGRNRILGRDVFGVERIRDYDQLPARVTWVHFTLAEANS